MKEIDNINATLDRIERNIPSRWFILFWLGVIPVAGVLLYLIIIN